MPRIRLHHTHRQRLQFGSAKPTQLILSRLILGPPDVTDRAALHALLAHQIANCHARLNAKYIMLGA